VTEYAVTVEYTGDFVVEADSADEARARVEAIIPSSTPDSDWYFVQIVDVKEES
jgi:hypothetical protein